MNCHRIHSLSFMSNYLHGYVIQFELTHEWIRITLSSREQFFISNHLYTSNPACLSNSLVVSWDWHFHTGAILLCCESIKKHAARNEETHFKETLCSFCNEASSSNTTSLAPLAIRGRAGGSSLTLHDDPPFDLAGRLLPEDWEQVSIALYERILM